jgi:adenylosuccinate lyase
MTSRDLTDNVEQLQIREAMRLIRDRYVSVLRHVADQAARWADVPIAARTHNVAAQPTTVGRRLAMFAQEMLVAFRRLEATLDGYALRGLVGAVGTALDQLTLFGGRADKVEQLNEKVRAHLDFAQRLHAVGQVYPRSMDFEVVAAVYQLGAGPASFCRTLRLMAGQELAAEGFQEGQVGSSAMPHKMNSRSCERVCGFQAILNGYLNMLAALSGDQWNEGDVSCSVVRRVALPGAFFAVDGMIETFLTILNEMVVYPAVIQSELDRYLPFLSTSTLLMEASKRFPEKREQLHAVIRDAAVAAATEMREQGRVTNDLAQRLAESSARAGLPIPLETIESVIAGMARQTGAAGAQIESLRAEIDAVIERNPEAARYEPAKIL